MKQISLMIFMGLVCAASSQAADRCVTSKYGTFCPGDTVTADSTRLFGELIDFSTNDSSIFRYFEGGMFYGRHMVASEEVAGLVDCYEGICTGDLVKAKGASGKDAAVVDKVFANGSITLKEVIRKGEYSLIAKMPVSQK